MPADRLYALLARHGIELSPYELAEALWLATRVDLHGAGPTAGHAAPPSAGAADGDAPGAAGSMPPAAAPARPSDRSAPVPDRDHDRVEVRLRAPDGTSAGVPTGHGWSGGDVGPGPSRGSAGAGGGSATAAEPPVVDTIPGIPVQVPTSAALPGSLGMWRALRPLKRRSPSARDSEVDEDETALQVAERRLWVPAMRPVPERWLELTLLLDRTSFGDVWGRLATELQVLLERLGASRTMRVLYLHHARGDVRLGVTPEPRPGGLLPPGALTGLPGNHLILLVSDCVGSAWRSGAMGRTLAMWSRQAAVAILQPLPEHLWPRTGLAPVAGWLRAGKPGACTARYAFTPRPTRRPVPPIAAPVPVLEIDADWLRDWANLVAGMAPAGIEAVVPGITAPDSGHGPAPPPARPAARDRVADFRADASRGAYLLARHLAAAVPLNLAIMRMVQRLVLPDPRSAELAEVLYGGILEPVPGTGAGTAAEDRQYEFIAGVRDVLVGTLRGDDAWRVFDEVSRYLEQRLERAGASFAAVVATPAGGLTVPALREPFAAVRARLLNRLPARHPVPSRGDRGHGGPTGHPEPGTPTPTRHATDDGGHRRVERLTILHLAGLAASGRRAQRTGPAAPGPAGGPAAGWLADVSRLRGHGLAPDLVVVAGDLAHRAMPRDYTAAERLLGTMRDQLQLPAGRILVVPGMTDVNTGRCEAYFLDREGGGETPAWPYWPKWEPFAAMLARFGVTITSRRPWYLREFADLRTVVAALNSTMAVTHREGERFGSLGETQLRWFGQRMAGYAGRGWLRIGVLHHDPTAPAEAAGRPRDAEDFDDVLGRHLDLILHGHPSGVHELPLTRAPTIGVRATGAGRDRDEGLRGQIVDVRPGHLRISRRDGAAPTGWAGTPESHRYGDHWWFAVAGDTGPVQVAGPAGYDVDDMDDAGSETVARVVAACRVRDPQASIQIHPWTGVGVGYPGPASRYLLVTPTPGRAATNPGCVGVYHHPPNRWIVRRFREDVVAQNWDAGARHDATLVCLDDPGDDLCSWAADRGVAVVRLAEFQVGADLMRDAGRQAELLGSDPDFPPHWYVPARYRRHETGRPGTGDPLPGLAGRMVEWLSGPRPGAIAVLGRAGTGKSFLLRELARGLRLRRDPILPVLVRLEEIDRGYRLDELLLASLGRGGVRSVNLDVIRYLLREGRLVLLCDGLDDLVGSVDPMRLLSRWGVLTEAAGLARIVLVSRDIEVLAEVLGSLPGAQVVELVGFDDGQVVEYFDRRLPDGAAVAARLDLLAHVGELRRMCRNPRMLAFIADLPEQQLRQAAAATGRAPVAEVYEQLVRRWLDSGRRWRSGQPLLDHDPLPHLRPALTLLAHRLWRSRGRTLDADALGDAADQLLTTLAVASSGEVDLRRSDAVRLLANGSLLIRAGEGYRYIDDSLVEWLIAQDLADDLRAGGPIASLHDRVRREMSPLMIGFLCRYAGAAAARGWAEAALADPVSPGGVRANALGVLRHLDQP